MKRILLAGAALLACLPFAEEALAQAQPVPDQSAVSDVLPQGAVYVDLPDLNLDDWGFIAPQLQDLYETLNSGKARHAFAFDPAQCMAPLPRAYQWADGSAYLNHVELVRAARNSEVPATYYTDPLMYQGGSDDFMGPCDDVVCISEDWGIDFESEITAGSSQKPSDCKKFQVEIEAFGFGLV